MVSAFLSKLYSGLVTSITYTTRFSPHGNKISLVNSLPYFPLAGFIVGFVAWLFLFILEAVTPTSVAVVIGAVIYPVYLYMVNKGRYMNHLLKISKFVSNQYDEDGDEHEILTSISQHSSLVVLFFFFICKSVVTGILIKYEILSWLIVPPVVSAALYAERCRMQAEPKRKALVPDKIWLIAAVLVFFVAGITGFAVVCLSWLLGYKSLEWASKNESELMTVLMVAACEIIECLAVLLGLFLL